MGQVSALVQGHQGKKTRNALRRRTRTRVTISYLGSMTAGLLVDLSTTGAAMELMGYFSGVVGDSIILDTEGFHLVQAKIRWFRQRRIGVEFEACTNTAAKVHSYFKYVHKDRCMPQP
jgi:hypothetical protein